MPMITLEQLKEQRQDYFLADWLNNELEMRPYCHCGNELEEEYYCGRCERQCECTFIACRNTQTLAVVDKFVHGNPQFKNFKTGLLAP